MQVQNGTFTRTNSFASERDRVIPRFFTDSVLDQIASEREGRPIYREEERVEIILPGNPHTKPVAKVTQEHKDRWPDQYKAFKSGKEMSLDGTPIEQWPILNRGMVLELKALELHTVEQLAGMDDLACQRIGRGGFRLRTLAQGYLDDAKASAALSEATAQVERQNDQIAELSRKVAEQAELLGRVHGELQAMKDAPSPVATMIPGMLDPVEQAKRNPEPAAGSALDGIAALGKRKKG